MLSTYPQAPGYYVKLISRPLCRPVPLIALALSLGIKIFNAPRGAPLRASQCK